MNDPEPTHNPEQEIVEQKVRRAVGINALRKIGVIVAEEQQADVASANVLRWCVRFGWIILLGGALLLAYTMGFI
jgi:hypothetical protein